METMLLIANQLAIAMGNQSKIIQACDPMVLQEGAWKIFIRNIFLNYENIKYKI